MMKEQIDILQLEINPNVVVLRDISWNEKFLLSMLLQQEKKGEKLDYTNASFIPYFHLSIRQISRLLNHLKLMGYIDMVEIDYERIITITEKTKRVVLSK